MYNFNQPKLIAMNLIKLHKIIQKLILSGQNILFLQFDQVIGCQLLITTTKLKQRQQQNNILSLIIDANLTKL